MKKIGIIGALAVEVELLKSKMQQTKETVLAGRTFFEGKIEGVDVVVTSCGIGKVNAASTAQVLATNFGVTMLINTGIAGALAAGVDVLDVVISENLVYHDFNADFVRIGISNFEAFEADKDMIALAKAVCENLQDGKNFQIGRIATGDEFVSERSQKNAIAEKTKALCVEMEGAAIAHVAAVNGLPFVVLRCISDNADDNAELTYEEFEPIAANKCANILLEILKKL